MAKLKEKVINLLGTDLYYKVVGEGIPILMLHGWGVDHRLMSGCMELVFKDGMQKFMRIYIDLPGMGQSKASKSIKKSDDVLEIILAFIDKVIPEQKFILVGESYGGYLARALVQKKSSMILGLLLICPLVYPGYRKGEVPAMTVLEKEMSLLESLNDRERSYFEYITIVQNRKVWDRFKRSIYDALINQDSYFLNNVLDGAFTYDVDKLEKAFDKPSLILVGRQDTEVGYKDQFKLLENYPRASFVVLDKAGHNLQIEQEELFISVVTEWLKRVLAEL
ncbi:MAG: alpha/beta fold hydrolase [Bacillota bacterium]